MLRVVLLTLAILLVALQALAAPPTRIALVREPGSGDGFPRRLRAELDSMGIQVVEVPAPDTAPSHESLEQAARDAGAFAAVRVAPRKGGVEVWIADRVTGKTVLRELVARRGETDDEIVALRVVELLRASLLELDLHGAPHGDVKPAPAVRRLVPKPLPAPVVAPARPGEAALGLELGPGVAYSPSGIPPAPLLRLGARFDLGSGAGADLLVLAPTFPQTVDDSEGSAAVLLALFGAGADVSLLPAGGVWRSHAGAGAALVYLHVTGSAAPPFVAQTQARWLAAGFGRLELGRAIGGGTFLGLELVGGMTASRAVVSFAGREVAGWGQPFGVASLLLEIPAP